MIKNEKITPGHLERLAVVYVRQSTMRQVRENRESADRQYALRAQAQALGWPEGRIRTIDADQGASGSVPGQRDGFAVLRDEVAHGRVGAVFGLEVSRISRNAVEWFQLLDWCRATNTLVVENDRVYSPSEHDDSLILNIKGSLSESEIYMIRARMRGGLLNKAARGALYLHVPTGFVRDGETVIKDPDQQVQHAIGAVFRYFVEYGSARQATIMLLEEGIRLPRRRTNDPSVEWADASYGRVTTILHNPMMGGAYVFGRTRMSRSLDENDQLQQRCHRVAQQDWPILIENHHEGYVSWETWLSIQDRMAANRIPASPRAGKALLQGLVTCGHCGRALRVLYNKSWSYRCVPPMEKTRKSCMHLGGVRIDRVVEEAFLQAVAPAGVEAALEAERQSRSRKKDSLRSLQLEIERCAYQARLAERRYLAVDPDNRLIAGSLERSWELALRALEDARSALQQAERALPAALDPARLAALGERLDRLWRMPDVTAQDRKRLLACVVEEVMLRIDRDAGQIHILLRWKGGAYDEFALPVKGPRKPPGDADDADGVALTRRLARLYNDSQVAGMLNQRGLLTPRGLPFSRDRVQRLRERHGIAAYAPASGDQAAPILSVAEAAAELKISDMTLYRMIRKGLVATEHDGKGAPIRIRMTAALQDLFRNDPPDGFIPMKTAMAKLGVSRQRIWQRIRDGELESCHVRHGHHRGLYVRLDDDRQMDLFADAADPPAPSAEPK